MWLYFHTINHAIQVFFKVSFLGFVDAPVMCILSYSGKRKLREFPRNRKDLNIHQILEGKLNVKNKIKVRFVTRFLLQIILFRSLRKSLCDVQN